jgi:release factor glutamine methyltransferase
LLAYYGWREKIRRDLSQVDTTSEKTWSVIGLLNATREFLDAKKFESPRTNAELLLGHALGLSRIDLYLQHDRPVTDEERERMRELLTRRLSHEPPQYITGETEFYGIPLRVTPGVPIPRPETEIVVEKAIEIAKRLARKRSDETVTRILDIGTGTGNIALALAAQLPKAVVEATDTSEEVLGLALENATRAGLADRVHPRHWDVFSDRIPSALHPPYCLVVSNPPYVADGEFDKLPREVRDFEPKSAFAGGEEGLRFYRRFAELAGRLLVEDGALVVEIGETQGETVEKILRGAFEQTRVFPDLSGADRVIVAEGLGGIP